MTVFGMRFDCPATDADAIARFVGIVAREARLPDEKAYWLRLAVEEITTNIWQHGYRGSGQVRLIGGVEDRRAWIRIEDEAPAFDPRTHDPGPRLAMEPAEREEGGFGLLLALHKLDEFRYERTRGRNCNTLIMCHAVVGPEAGQHVTDGIPDDQVNCADSRRPDEGEPGTRQRATAHRV